MTEAERLRELKRQKFAEAYARANAIRQMKESKAKAGRRPRNEESPEESPEECTVENCPCQCHAIKAAKSRVSFNAQARRLYRAERAHR